MNVNTLQVTAAFASVSHKEITISDASRRLYLLVFETGTMHDDEPKEKAEKR